VYPKLSTLQDNPAFLLGLPIKNTPLTESNAGPEVIWIMASTVAVAPCE
jgi:hypothetical protein